MPSISEESYKFPKRVSIEKADNGYVVRCSTQKGEQQMVCKTMDDVMEAVQDMMGAKEKKENYNDVKEKANAKMMKK